MKKITEMQIDTLHQSNHTIKGNEPFLRFHKCGLIVNFNSYGGQSHNFTEIPLGSAWGVPLDALKSGDTLQFQIRRIYSATRSLTLKQRIILWLQKELNALL